MSQSQGQGGTGLMSGPRIDDQRMESQGDCVPGTVFHLLTDLCL